MENLRGSEIDEEAKELSDGIISTDNITTRNDLPTPREKSSGYGPAEHEFDTGSIAWLQVFGAFFLWFNSWGIINTFGVFQTYYEREILASESASSIAWIGSLESFLLLFGGVVTGPLFDAGYFYFLLPFGTFMVSFGYMMTSIATQYYQIMLAQGICVGIGTGCLFVPSVALLPQYFRKRRALVNGLAASGSSIGGIIYPIMFYRLEQQVGFGWATRALGFVSLGTCAISIAVLRVRFPPKEKRALIQLSAFKEVDFLLFCLAMFVALMGFYNFLTYCQAWAIQRQIVDENLGFYLLPMLNAGSTFGRIMPNYIADHWGPLNLFTPAACITAMLAFSWIAVNSTAGIIILALLYGFFSGGFVSLPPVVMAVITEDFRSFGTRLGMLFAIVSLALLVGTPIGGAILGDTHSYLGLQLFSGACLITASIISIILRMKRSGPKFLYKT